MPCWTTWPARQGRRPLRGRHGAVRHAVLIFQLLGVAGVKALGLSVPGPVAGMILLLGSMLASARLADTVRPAGQGIGVARAVQVHETAGAFAAVGMGLSAILTAVLVPVLAHLLLG